MKFLRFFSLGALVSCVLIIIIGLFLPSGYRIEEVILIDAPSNVVYQQINQLSNWKYWVFEDLEKQGEYQSKTEGNKEGLGSTLYWENAQSNGRLEIIESVPQEKIKVEIAMQEGEFISTSTFELAESEAMTKVSWTDEGSYGYNFIARIHSQLTSFEKRMGENYQQGLQKLKMHCESHALSANQYMHQANFDALVERFENEERKTWQKPEDVIAWAGNLNGLTIGEIGAGTGYFTFRLADKAKHVIAIDIDRQFLQFIRQKLDSLSIENIETRLVGENNAGLAKEEVDKVFIINTYHHLENRVSYFENLKSGLKEGGEIIIVDFKEGDLPQGPPKNLKVSLAQMENELSKAGFSFVQKSEELLPYQFILKMKK